MLSTSLVWWLKGHTNEALCTIISNRMGRGQGPQNQNVHSSLNPPACPTPRFIHQPYTRQNTLPTQDPHTCPPIETKRTMAITKFPIYPNPARALPYILHSSPHIRNAIKWQLAVLELSNHRKKTLEHPQPTDQVNNNWVVLKQLVGKRKSMTCSTFV